MAQRPARLYNLVPEQSLPSFQALLPRQSLSELFSGSNHCLNFLQVFKFQLSWFFSFLALLLLCFCSNFQCPNPQSYELSVKLLAILHLSVSQAWLFIHDPSASYSQVVQKIEYSSTAVYKLN